MTAAFDPPACQNCQHWQGPLVGGKRTDLGLCLRYSPSPIGLATEYGPMGVWPLTSAASTCGEHVGP